MLVHTPFRKSCECEINTRIRLNLRRKIELHKQHATTVWDNEAPKQMVNLRFELLFQPHTSIQVQMVRWLIE